MELDGKCKLVYTVPVHHNPTGIIMSQAKRERLVAMARKYKFYVIADEAYQLLSFEEGAPGVVPMYYEDDASDPRVLSIGTFSKLIGPGIKVGWIQAHPSLLKPISGIGFINSGNNPVIFNSCGLAEFIESGNLKKKKAGFPGLLKVNFLTIFETLRVYYGSSAKIIPTTKLN